MLFADINIYGIVTVGTTYAIDKRQIHHFRMLAQPPYIGFIACKTCAMDTALLTCADAYCLSVFNITYGVALCIFESYKTYDKVAACFFRECLVLCRDIFKQSR